MLNTSFPKNEILQVLLITLLASLGCILILYIAPETIGKILFSSSKLGLLIISIITLFLINNREINIVFPKSKELLLGITSGILIFIVIISSYQIFGYNHLNNTNIILKANQLGINSLNIYLFSAIYGVFFNPLIEEYLWRGFVYAKCKILTSEIIAIFLTAFLFTLHHIIILSAFTSNFLVILLSLLGIFIGSVIWSFFYLNFESLWASYISHLCADLALIIIGWQLLFT